MSDNPNISNSNNPDNCFSSSFENVDLAPPDPIFHLSAQYKQDNNPEKIDLSVGAYRTDHNKPYVLPCVQIAESMILESQKPLTQHNSFTEVSTKDNNNNNNLLNLEDHEYLGIDGRPEFLEQSALLLLGKNSQAIKENKVITIQTISGTGANYLFGIFMKQYYLKSKTIILPNPTWGNHKNIFKQIGFEILEYPYFDKKTNSLDLKNMLLCFSKCPKNSIVLLHTCAHNPTGVDPTKEQWLQISETLKKYNLFPFFDNAYQGFASGDVDKDAYSVRLFEDQKHEFFVAQSFSKNFGLYGQRIGALNYISNSNNNTQVVQKVKSQLKRLNRATISNPPKHGAQIVSTILNNKELKEMWIKNLNEMSNRIKSMRKELHKELNDLKTPGNWDHIINQIGMFTFTGLNENQCKTLKEKFSTYLTNNGRISMAGLNSNNVKKFAKYVDYVVREIN